MGGMHSVKPLQVANVAVLIVNPYNNEKFVAVLNQSLLITDENHREGLLQPNQARAFGTAIDDCSRQHLGVDGKPGTQSMKVPGHTIGLLHDGWKAYLYIERPSDDDMDKYPVIELTSPMKYEPHKRYQTRRVKSF